MESLIGNLIAMELQDNKNFDRAVRQDIRIEIYNYKSDAECINVFL